MQLSDLSINYKLKTVQSFSKLRSTISIFPITINWIINRIFGKKYIPELVYIVPENRWSLFWDAFYITREVSNQFNLRTHVSSKPYLLAGQILHYGELGVFLHHIGSKHNHRNTVIATIFHGDINPKYPASSQRVTKFLQNSYIPEKIVVTCTIMENRLMEWGITPEKLVKIPLGVDLKQFIPATPNQREYMRRKIGIPDNSICIGSFQKDGIGWGEGFDPKLIKGPDIFLRVVENLFRKIPNLFILLSGPARGYIKQGLDSKGIPYIHKYVANYLEIVDLYQCLDLYLVTSREEGGPKGILESMACGIPLIATRVGMAPDLIQNGINGYISEVEDEESLISQVYSLIGDNKLKTKFITNGLKVIKEYDWNKIAVQYFENLYYPLLKS